jgi:hypothetical protein
MPIIVQRKDTKGSQYWLQQAVNRHPGILSMWLKSKLNLNKSNDIEWLSPLAKDNYLEYKDNKFVKKLEIELPDESLESFWPRHGATWDALAKTSNGDVLLVEAKAHIPELLSGPCGAKEPALTKIRESLDRTQKFLGVTPRADWSQTFYQYTNRLAHLYLLRELNHLPAWLVFMYFVNAQDVDGPCSVDEWKGAIKLMHLYLGINNHRLSKYMIDLFIDVNELKES